MDGSTNYTWQDEGDQGRTLDLRFTTMPDGKIKVQNLRSDTETTTFDSLEQCQSEMPHIFQGARS